MATSHLTNFHDRPVKPDAAYEWLEAQEAADCLRWTDQENKLTSDALDSLPSKGAISSRLEELANTVVQCPEFATAGKLFRLRKTVESKQGILEVAENDADGAPRSWEPVLDTDELNRAEGKGYELRMHGFEALAFGPNASRLLLMFSDGGSDLVEMREFNLEARHFVDDGFSAGPGRISAAWLDIDTILIQHALNGGQTTSAHWPTTAYIWKRGIALNEAKAVYTVPSTDSIAFVGSLGPSDSGRALITRMIDFSNISHAIVSLDGTTEEVDLPKRQTLLSSSCTTAEHIIASLSQQSILGGRAVPAGTIVAYNTSPSIAPEERVTVVWSPEPDEFTPFLGTGNIVTTRKMVHFTVTKDSTERWLAFEPCGSSWKQVRSDQTPTGCSLSLVSGDVWTEDVVTKLSGILYPSEFRLEREDGARPVLFVQDAAFDGTAFTAQELTAQSKDGTSVEYTLLSPNKVSAVSGSQPVLMTGYGAFGITMPYEYMSAVHGGITLVTWLEHGGSLALPRIRGGGERGSAWHESAQREHRQRSYDDFIAVAERLIADDFTSAGRIGVFGLSNGGLLAAVMGTQRPDLFGAVVSDVPLTDMLRFPKMGMGFAWVEEYGDPENPEMAKVLASYSPFHNVRDGVKYPPFLVTISTKDDRVGAGHARKLVARLKDSGAEKSYLFEERDGGHGVSDSFKKTELMSRRMSFFIDNLVG